MTDHQPDGLLAGSGDHDGLLSFVLGLCSLRARVAGLVSAPAVAPRSRKEGESADMPLSALLGLVSLSRRVDALWPRPRPDEDTAPAEEHRVRPPRPLGSLFR